MRLLVDISAHGFGHLAQTSLILSAVRDQEEVVDLVVRSGLDETTLREWLGPAIRHVPSDTDFGLVMRTPFSVDSAATLERYLAVHSRFRSAIDEVADLIRDERCAAVLSNVGYLAVAAAGRAGVPAVACSSLNWGDVLLAYCGAMSGADAILAQIDAAYSGADTFARLVPGMPMTRLRTTRIPAPLARVGTARREDVAATLQIDPRRPLVLCAFGGMLPPEPPPFLECEELATIGPETWVAAGAISARDLAIPFADLIASVDVVVSKPGYGIVAELGCAGTPSILVSRNDWPEEPYLLDWLAKRSCCTVVRHVADLDANLIRAHLASARAGVPPRRATPGGEAAVAQIVRAAARAA